jgi:hypothetical protein
MGAKLYAVAYIAALYALAYTAPANAANSPDGSFILPGAAGSLTTAEGVWTFEALVPGGNTNIDLNGKPAGNGRAQILEIGNGKMYARASDGSWWMWNGFTWADAAPPPAPIVAGHTILTWVLPTTNTDGSAIGSADAITVTNLEYGTCNADKSFGVRAGLITVPVPLTQQDVALVVAQEYCFRATATSKLNQTSDFSNVARVQNAPPAPLPQPPANLTALAGATVYVLGQTHNRLDMVPVGSTTATAACDTRYSANGMYAVPVEVVHFASPSDAVLVFSRCQ